MRRPAASDGPIAQAKREFEVIPARYADGTSTLFSRGDFLPFGDPRAMSEADFIGRLRALFGPRRDDEYVLRHRETGFVVTASVSQSGPSYGGGPRYEGALPRQAGPSHAQLYEEAQARTARAAAASEPMQPPTFEPGLQQNPDVIRDRNERWHAWRRRQAELLAPPGFAAVVARLDELLSALTPVDD